MDKRVEDIIKTCEKMTREQAIKELAEREALE